MTDAVAFDASFLLPVFSRNLHTVPDDPSTGKPIERYYERIDRLLSQLKNGKVRILVPSPALSEILVRVEAKQVDEYLKKIYSRFAFSVAYFEEEAAIEVAMMTAQAIKQGDKREGSLEPWQKVKFDRQIIAIARVAEAKAVYSDDNNLRRFAEQVGLKAIASHELGLP